MSLGVYVSVFVLGCVCDSVYRNIYVSGGVYVFVYVCICLCVFVCVSLSVYVSICMYV